MTTPTVTPATAADNIDPLAPESEEEDLSHLLPPDDIPAGDELDENELARLTDEERAAWNAEEGADTDGTTDEAALAQAQEPAAAEVPANPAPVADPAPAAAAADPVLPARPEVDVDAAKATIDATKADKAKAFERYEDGELTREEYLAELDTISDREAGAKADLKRIEAYDAEVAEVAAQQFETFKANFTARATEYLKAHPGLMDETHLDSYDKHVRDVLNNETLRTRLTHDQILALAHKRYLTDAEAMGVTAPPLAAVSPQPAADPPPPAAAQKPVAPPPPTERPQLPPTIQDMPSAALSGPRDGKYGQLQDAIERADAATAERLMASLSEEEREAFASMDV